MKCPNKNIVGFRSLGETGYAADVTVLGLSGGLNINRKRTMW